MSVERKLVQILTRAKRTIGLAESCTGGLVGHRITNISGSSVILRGGLIAYSNPIKTKVLGVPEKLIHRHGAVSAPVVKAMAKRARLLFRSDYGVGISGIAGPTGGTPLKPVGLVHIAACSKKRVLHKELHLKGNRLSIKNQAATRALKLLATLSQSES